MGGREGWREGGREAQDSLLHCHKPRHRLSVQLSNIGQCLLANGPLQVDQQMVREQGSSIWCTVCCLQTSQPTYMYIYIYIRTTLSLILSCRSSRSWRQEVGVSSHDNYDYANHRQYTQTEKYMMHMIIMLVCSVIDPK